MLGINCPYKRVAYVLPSSSKVVFDNPLKWLREQKDPCVKYAGWIVELEALPYEIISQNGLDQIAADCMSCRRDPSREEEIQNDKPYLENHIFVLRVGPTNEKWMERIRKEQSADEAIRFGLQQLTERGMFVRVLLNAIKEFIWIIES